MEGKRPKFTERLVYYKSLTYNQIIIEAVLIILNHENWDTEVKAIRKALEYRRKQSE